MRLLPAMILGFVLLAAPVHSATPPSEAELVVQLQAATKEKERLEAELNSAKTRPSGGIKAEVRGMMMKENTGYYILTRMDRGVELRVWVRATHPHVANWFDTLVGKDVWANGQLVQGSMATPGVASSSAPQQRLHLVNQTIREAAYVVEIVPPSIPTVPPSLPTVPSLPLPANPK